VAQLTHEELSLLNSLIYIETDLWNRSDVKLGDIIKELLRNPNWRPGGAMSRAECEDILKAVQKNPSLCQLELFKVPDSDYKEYNTKPSLSRVLTFKNGNNPIVVFKGTEGEEEWADNVLGGVDDGTDAQERALAHMKILHEKYGFENITVSGHSKGGNKAMFVSVLLGYVTQCVAFDSQGFSIDFYNKYKDLIEARKYIITEYAPDKAIVNPLLISIAGTTIIISTEGLPPELMSVLYHTPNIFFAIDADGNVAFHKIGERSELSKFINELTCYLSINVPEPQRSQIFNYIASMLLSDSDFMKPEGQKHILSILMSLGEVELHDGTVVSSSETTATIIAYLFEFLKTKDLSYDQVVQMLKEYGIDTASMDTWWLPVVYDMLMDVAKTSSPAEFAEFMRSLAAWGESKGLTSWEELLNYIGEDPMNRIFDCYSSLGADKKYVHKIIAHALSIENIAKFVAAYAVEHPWKTAAITAAMMIPGANVVAAIVVSLVTVALVANYIYAHWDEIKKFICDTIDAIKNAIVKLYCAIRDKIRQGINEATAFVFKQAEKLITGVRRVKDAIKDVYESAKNTLTNIKNATVSYMKKQFKANFPGLYNLVSNVFGAKREPLHVDMRRLRDAVNEMSRLANRVATMDSRLDNLYRQLSQNNIEQGENVWTSLCNMYNLLRADINVDEGAAIKRKARSITELFGSYEKMDNWILNNVPKKI